MPDPMPPDEAPTLESANWDESSSVGAGERQGHLCFVRLLGRGGMGEVYEGFDENLKRRVAIKTIRTDRGLPEGARLRFLREARILSALDHPNICRIYDYVTTENRDLLILELIEGTTLTQCLGKLDAATRLKIARQIAGTLVAAHQAGVVHRDLKPGNVMLTTSGETKVLDFGLARPTGVADEGPVEPAPEHPAAERGALRSPRDDGGVETLPHVWPPEANPSSAQRPVQESLLAQAELTTFGEVIGTPSFMSPEQARGEPLGPASDMYSFGLVLQSLWSSRSPYGDSHDPIEILARARTGESEEAVGLPSDVAALIRRLKAREPEKRPTAYETGEVLQRIAEKGQRRLRYGLAAAAVLMIIASVAKYTHDLGQERDQAEIARQEAVQQAARSEAVSDFLEQILEAPDPGAGGARSVTVEQALDLAAARLEKSFSEMPETEGAVRLVLGRTLAGLEKFDEAEEQLLKAAEAFRSLHGDALHADSIHTKRALAWLYLQSDRFERGEELAEAALQESRELYGDDHLEVAECLLTLSDAKDGVADPAASIELSRQAIDLFVKHLGADSERLVAARSDLAFWLIKATRYSEAKEEATLALELARRIHGESHPELLAPARALAASLNGLGEHEAAEAILIENVARARSFYGERHSAVAWSLNDLGLSRRSKGDWTGASEAFQEALGILGDTVGSEHSEYVIVLENLGGVFYKEGRYDQCLEILERVLNLRRKIFGPQSLPAARTLSNMALVLVAAQRYEEAGQRQAESHAALVESFGETHLEVASSLESLGSILQARGDRARAADTFRRVLAIRQQLLGLDHELTALAKIRLGLALDPTTEGEEAEHHVLEGFRARLAKAPGTPQNERLREEIVHWYGERGIAPPAEVLDGRQM